MKTWSDLQGDGGSDVLGQVLAQRREVAERLETVDGLLVLTSGKGGVGKSTVAVNLAAALAAGGAAVGVLDADLNGPSVPRLTGLSGSRARAAEDGLVPPEGPHGLRVVSTELFLGTGAEPLRYDGPRESSHAWRALAEATTLRELLGRTRWGRLDWLVVDMPPGSERLSPLLEILPRPAAGVFVTTGSEVSLRVVARSVTAARDQGLAVAGLVENMAARPCASCGDAQPLFGRPGAVSDLAAELDAPLLGALPFDPELAEGTPAGAGLPGARPPAAGSPTTRWSELARRVAERAAELGAVRSAAEGGRAQDAADRLSRQDSPDPDSPDPASPRPSGDAP